MLLAKPHPSTLPLLGQKYHLAMLTTFVCENNENPKNNCPAMISGTYLAHMAKIMTAKQRVRWVSLQRSKITLITASWPPLPPHLLPYLSMLLSWPALLYRSFRRILYHLLLSAGAIGMHPSKTAINAKILRTRNNGVLKVPVVVIERKKTKKKRLLFDPPPSNRQTATALLLSNALPNQHRRRLACRWWDGCGPLPYNTWMLGSTN